MWISIRTKRIDLSPRMRSSIEAHISRVFQREKGQIASAIVSLGPAKLSGELLMFTCRIRLWSSQLGLITVSDVGDTVRTAVQQASLRARHVARRRLHKRRTQRQRISRASLGRWLPGIKSE
jgi:ribosome-associated translation inhibitor RaiA